MRRRAAFALLLALLFFCPRIGQAEAWTGQIQGVLDGLDFSSLDALAAARPTHASWCGA